MKGRKIKVHRQISKERDRDKRCLFSQLKTEVRYPSFSNRDFQKKKKKKSACQKNTLEYFMYMNLINCSTKGQDNYKFLEIHLWKCLLCHTI